MTVDTTRVAWVTRAEAAIRALRDVEGVNIQLEGDGIREIHVLTQSKRPAKQIVRDVQTVLLTRFNRSIDYRVVSVAYADAEPVSLPLIAPSPTFAGDVLPPASARIAPAGVAPAPAATPARVVDAPAAAAAAERIRFASVNLFVAGPRTQAQVELKWKGLPRMGSASGWSTRSGSHRLVASATIAAVQEFLIDELPLGVQAVEFARIGRERVVIASLVLLAQRQEKTLVGSCPVEQDVPQAVVLATLAAMNRIVGGLATREPTEYVVRPTSN